MVATKEIEATGKKTEMEKREELAAEQSRGRSMTMRERLCQGSHWTGKRETAVRWPDVRFAPSMARQNPIPHLPPPYNSCYYSGKSTTEDLEANKETSYLRDFKFPHRGVSSAQWSAAALLVETTRNGN